MINSIQSKKIYPEAVGLIPAAGIATRLAPLPCSKELYPIGFYNTDEDGDLHPKVVSHYLIEKMKFAGISKVFFVLRDGKWDIPSYLSNVAILDIHIAYLVITQTSGVPFTLDLAYPFVQDVIVAFGFPDIIFQTNDAFVQLLARQAATNADVVLGLFPTDEPQKKDMVDLDKYGKIRLIEKNPSHSHLQYTWSIAIWTPAFTDFMHKHLAALREFNNEDTSFCNAQEGRELTVGEVIQAAIDNDLIVEGIIFPEDSCLDIGSPQNLHKAVRNFGKILDDF